MKGDAPGPQTSMCGGRRTRSETPPSMKNCPCSLYSQSDHFPVQNGLLLFCVDEQSLRPQSSGAKRHDFTSLTPRRVLQIIAPVWASCCPLRQQKIGEVMAVSLTTVWRNRVQCSPISGDRYRPRMGIQKAHPYPHGKPGRLGRLWRGDQRGN